MNHPPVHGHCSFAIDFAGVEEYYNNEDYFEVIALGKKKTFFIIILCVVVIGAIVAAIALFPRTQKSNEAETISLSQSTSALSTELQTAELPTAEPYTGTDLTTIAQIEGTLQTGFIPTAISCENTDGTVAVSSDEAAMNSILDIIKQLEPIAEPEHAATHDQSITFTYDGGYQLFHRYGSVNFECNGNWYTCSEKDSAELDNLIAAMF